MYDDDRPTGEQWVEITGGDVWNAVKTGAKLSFFLGIVVGVAMMFTGKGEYRGFETYLVTLALCLFAGTCVYIPLNLGVVATSRCRGFLPGLLRFGHGLVVFAGVAAMVLVLGARLLAALFRVAG